MIVLIRMICIYKARVYYFFGYLRLKSPFNRVFDPSFSFSYLECKKLKPEHVKYKIKFGSSISRPTFLICDERFMVLSAFLVELIIVQ